jgi:hypothetical protein
MKNANKLAGIAVLALAAVFSFAACNTGTSSGDPTSASYSGYDPVGNRYALTIRDSGRAAYSPKDGDKYTLTISVSGGNKTRTGTGTVKIIPGGFTLTGSKAGTLNITVSGSGITEITDGEITFDDDEIIRIKSPIPLSRTAPPSSTDIWTKVNDWDQMNGTWEGSGSRSVRDEYKVPDWLGGKPEVIFGMKTKYMEATMYISTAEDKMISQKTYMLTFSGGNITQKANWDILKHILSLYDPGFPEEYDDDFEYHFDDIKHTAIRIEPCIEPNDYEKYPPGTIPVNISLTVAQQFPNGIYINQNGTKLREPADASDNPEMIYIRQYYTWDIWL